MLHACMVGPGLLGSDLKGRGREEGTVGVLDLWGVVLIGEKDEVDREYNKEVVGSELEDRVAEKGRDDE